MTTSNIRVDGKVAIVTGAGRGQGAATAAALSAAGATVYLTDVDRDVGEAAAAAAAGTFIRHDVADPAGWHDVVGRVMDEQGRVDVLVNNAGIIEWSTMTATSFEVWQRILGVNQTGVFLGMQTVAPIMTGQRAGSIVNISSIGGLGGSSPCFAYGATKWAIRGMTRGAAQELGPFGVRVNAVLPGSIESRMIEAMDHEAMSQAIPLRRIGEPSDVARVTLWLASDESAYVSGADVLVDGGLKA